MKNASLTLTGTGIKFLSHMTLEAKTYIEKSDKVLYLVNDPVLKQWINTNSLCSESLDEIYFGHTLRANAYRAISAYILSTLKTGLHICVALYGHPSVFSQPGLDAIRQARSEGYDARIIPGISAEDCLFADLLIDPGEGGCQSYEATDLLMREKKIDTSSHLVLWQPDIIGTVDHVRNSGQTAVALLIEYLQIYYPTDHEIIIYEAAQYPGMTAKIMHTPLEHLDQKDLSPISTLYIKPLQKHHINSAFAKKLKINL